MLTVVVLVVLDGWCPDVWRLQLDVVGARVCDGGSWMCLVSTCVALQLECGCCPRLWGFFAIKNVLTIYINKTGKFFFTQNEMPFLRIWTSVIITIPLNQQPGLFF